MDGFEISLVDIDPVIDSVNGLKLFSLKLTIPQYTDSRDSFMLSKQIGEMVEKFINYIDRNFSTALEERYIKIKVLHPDVKAKYFYTKKLANFASEKRMRTVIVYEIDPA